MTGGRSQMTLAAAKSTFPTLKVKFSYNGGRIHKLRGNSVILSIRRLTEIVTDGVLDGNFRQLFGCRLFSCGCINRESGV